LERIEALKRMQDERKKEKVSTDLFGPSAKMELRSSASKPQEGAASKSFKENQSPSNKLAK